MAIIEVSSLLKITKENKMTEVKKVRLKLQLNSVLNRDDWKVVFTGAFHDGLKIKICSC